MNRNKKVKDYMTGGFSYSKFHRYLKALRKVKSNVPSYKYAIDEALDMAADHYEDMEGKK